MEKTKRKIAIQGIRASWHDVAAQKHFGNDIELIECDSFRILCNKLKGGEADFAVMAIENTIAGSILPNYALIHEYKFNITGEIYIHIQMQLMALPGTRISDVEIVASHPMAILQCAEFLKTMKNVRMIEKEDTAKTAKEIKENTIYNTATIAGIQAAKEFKLDVIQNNIETDKQNFTRFLVLSRTQEKNESSNKASICFSLPHKVGSLAEVLNLFVRNNVNLTKIQSLPIIGKPYQYSFHSDLVFDKPENYLNAIKRLEAITVGLEILGVYPNGEKPAIQSIN